MTEQYCCIYILTLMECLAEVFRLNSMTFFSKHFYWPTSPRETPLGMDSRKTLRSCRCSRGPSRLQVGIGRAGRVCSGVWTSSCWHWDGTDLLVRQPACSSMSAFAKNPDPSSGVKIIQQQWTDEPSELHAHLRRRPPSKEKAYYSFPRCKFSSLLLFFPHIC